MALLELIADRVRFSRHDFAGWLTSPLVRGDPTALDAASGQLRIDLMPNVCIYLQVHRPYRLRHFRAVDVGTGRGYLDHERSRAALRQVTERCYLPANQLLRQLIHDSGGEFRVAMGLSGVVLEQLASDAPDALESFQALVATGGVELVGETYYHSLASLADTREFVAQVELHRALVQRLFDSRPRVFRNTGFIYNDALAPLIAGLGFHGVLVEGVSDALGLRSPNYVYQAPGTSSLRVVPRHAQLSEDVAFRFSERSWGGWPLTAEKLAGWIAHSPGDCVNLFLNYETFGEYQRAETGIFGLIERLPAECARRGVRFMQPSELLSRPPRGLLSCPTPTSWAEDTRDVSVWLGNRLQQEAHERLYQLRYLIEAQRRAEHLEAWRWLTTSDHLRDMSTRHSSAGEARAYVNPHATPYQAFTHFMNALEDLEQRGAVLTPMAIGDVEDAPELAGMAVVG